MTITGAQVVARALAAFRIQGVHYDQCGSRCTPEVSPHCVDCSGLTSYVLNQLGLAEGCTGSFAQSRECHAAHTGLPIDLAMHTAGAFLFQGVNEGQGGTPGVDPGHVGISAGDGVHTLEARGHWAGVGVFAGRSLVWDWAGMPPGVARITPPAPGPAPSPGPQLPPLAVQEDTMGMIALKIGDQPGRIATARAVREFNFVLLEDGARLVGDVPIDAHRHWWAPANLHKDIPGAQIIDVADGRAMNPPRNTLVVRYGYPNGDAGTYEATLA